MHKLLLAVAALALAAGCGNLVNRTGDGPNRGPYASTAEIAECVAAPFSEPKGSEGGIAKAYCTLLLPVTVLSLPFDAVIDTVMLPYDLWASRRKERRE